MTGYAYQVTGVIAEGLLEITTRDYGVQWWSISKMTYKHTGDKCALCGAIVGKRAYRPMTNLGNRMIRICIKHQVGDHRY